MNETADDHERFTRLLLAHEPEILRTVLPFVPYRADAQEVVQETAVALWRHFGSYDPARPFAAWAAGFARVEVRRYLRAQHRRHQLSERAAEALMAEQDASASQLSERESHLRDCLDRLPADQRRLIEGYYAQDLPVERLARDLGRSVEAVYKSLQRIRRALSDCIAQKMAHGATPS